MNDHNLWLIQSAATVVLLALTAMVGRRTERVAVAAYLGSWAATLASYSVFGGAYVPGVTLIADLLFLVVLLRLGWKSDRTWPVWATGPQAILVAVHFAYAQEPELGRRALAAAINFATFAVLALMVWGAVRVRIKPPATG